jgi:hypothetical protein
MTPSERKTKNYDCKLCEKHIVAVNKKEADETGGECKSFFQRWSRAIEVIERI